MTPLEAADALVRALDAYIEHADPETTIAVVRAKREYPEARAAVAHD